MKKVLALMAVLLMSIVAVAASVDITLNPENINLPDDKSPVTVDVQVTDASAYPVGLAVAGWCKETSGNPDWCDASDEFLTSEITVGVDSATDVTGAAKATLNWNGPAMGNYHYTLCVTDGGECVQFGASVTGDSYVPEFTAIGAGLALVGAGIIAARRRKD